MMIEFIAWLPWLFGFIAVLGFGAWFIDVVLPKLPMLCKFIDKLLEE